MHNLLDKIKGCLIGGAAGDALGFPVEFLSYSQIERRYGDGGIWTYDTNFDMYRSGKALVSDDTQMTMMAVFALTNDVFVGDAYMAWGRYQIREDRPSFRPQDKWWYKDVDFFSILKHKFITAHRAPGRTCLDAISHEYKVWNESKGCGAVMRAAPYGLIKDYEDGTKAIVDGNLTHKHPIGWMAGVILARIIHDIVYNKKKLIDAVEDNIEFVPSAYNRINNRGFHWENFNREKAIEEFQNLLKLAIKLAYNDRPNVECIKQLGQGWCGDEALAIAIFSALRFEDDFSDAICCAVNHDGDSDSTGAITGNILGALYGYEAIPDEWKHKLEGHDEILELATKFHDSMKN